MIDRAREAKLQGRDAEGEGADPDGDVMHAYKNSSILI